VTFFEKDKPSVTQTAPAARKAVKPPRLYNVGIGFFIASSAPEGYKPDFGDWNIWRVGAW